MSNLIRRVISQQTDLLTVEELFHYCVYMVNSFPPQLLEQVDIFVTGSTDLCN